jgi:alginate O-acetyltransferase complex protein AlgI
MMMRLSNGKSGIIDIICNLIFPTFLIFLILGFWHGPSWTYVLFGCMHGMYIVVNQLWKKAFPYKKSKSPMLFNIRSIFGWFVTFIAVNISFVMFRADSVSNAFQIYRVMLNPNEFLLILHRIQIGSIFDPLKGIWQSQLESNQSTLDSYILLIIGFIIVVFFPNSSSISSNNPFSNNRLLMRNRIAAILFAMLFVISIMQLGKTSPFLYFQF